MDFDEILEKDEFFANELAHLHEKNQLKNKQFSIRYKKRSNGKQLSNGASQVRFGIEQMPDTTSFSALRITPYPFTNTILPMCSLLSIKLCAAAASASGNSL
jgi:hypothetical protein